MPGGRPSSYTPEIGDKICSQLADGKSLRTVCKPDAMPNMSTIFEWIRNHTEFSNQYARAKQECADLMAEDILEIADDARNDFMLAYGDEEAPGYKVNGEHIQRSKLRIDTRKWAASKLAPKKYGDRIQHDTTVTIEEESDDKLDERIKRLIEKR